MTVGGFILNRNGILCIQGKSIRKSSDMGFQSGSPPPTTPEQETQISASQPVTQQQMQQMMLDMMNQLANILKNNPTIIQQIHQRNMNQELSKPDIDLQIDDSIVDVSSNKDLDRFEKKYDRITEDIVSEDTNLQADQDKLRQLLKGKK